MPGIISFRADNARQLSGKLRASKMVGPATDVVRNPLGAVRQLFAAALAAAKAADPSAAMDAVAAGSGDWGVGELFTQKLISDGFISQVPELTGASLPTCARRQCLVRVRAMVQDMWGNEFYSGTYTDGNGVLRTTKYMEEVVDHSAEAALGGRTDRYSLGAITNANMDMDAGTGMDVEANTGAIWERSVLYCVPVPGEQPWVANFGVQRSATPQLTADAAASGPSVSVKEAGKRLAEEAGTGPQAPASASSAPGGGEDVSLGEKRSRPNGSSVGADAATCDGKRAAVVSGTVRPDLAADAMDVEGDGDDSAAKRQCVEEDAAGQRGRGIRAEEGGGAVAAVGDTVGRDRGELVAPLPCVVKVYGGAEELKLNDVVEFVGVVFWQPHTDADACRSDAADVPDIAAADGSRQGNSSSRSSRGRPVAAEARAAPHGQEDLLWASLLGESGGGDGSGGRDRDLNVPRLHCFLARKLPDLLPPSPSLSEQTLALRANTSTFREIRATLLQRMTATLGGDAVAAEYLLLHLVSRVHFRVDPAAIGKLSLNLFSRPPSAREATGRAPAPVTPAAAAATSAAATRAAPATAAAGVLLVDAAVSIVHQLRPSVVRLVLQLQHLNTNRYGPWKDYANDRLVQGVLQLPSGSHLVVDESTALQSGAVSSLGLANLRALKELAEWQRVEYDYQYYKLDVKADVPVLVISSAARSKLVPADVDLPVAAESPFSAFVAGQSQLDMWRAFIGHARGLRHTIDEEMQQVVEADLVRARQNNPTVTADTFHRWMTVGRLMAASYGSTQLEREHWDAAMCLEQAAQRSKPQQP